MVVLIAEQGGAPLDLESYATSPGWAGYFWQDTKRFRAGALAANEVLLDYLARNPQPSLIMSSLILSWTEKQLRGQFSHLAKEARELSKAVDQNVVERRFSTGKYLAPGEEFVEPPIRTFPLSTDNLRGFLAASYSIMARGGLYGHLFLYLEKSQLLIYPHDDGGYGVFCVFPQAPSEDFFEAVNTEYFKIKRRRDY